MEENVPVKKRRSIFQELKKNISPVPQDKEIISHIVFKNGKNVNVTIIQTKDLKKGVFYFV